MATNRVVNGVTYVIPDQGDSFSWGTGVSAWIGAVTNGMLSKAGGLFTLTNDVDFGTTNGLKSLYFKSRNAIGNSGILQLGNTDTIVWAGISGGADVGVTVSASNYLHSNTGFDAGTNKVVNLVTPTNPTDAATKAYVDASSANAVTAAAGSNTQVQFNANGAFGASANLTFNVASNTLNVFGTINATTMNVTSGLTVNGVSVANAHRDTYSNVGVLTGATNVNCAVCVYQDVMLVGNINVGLQNAAAFGTATTLTLYVRQSANGGNTITWKNTINWSDNTVPVLSTTKNTADMFTFTSFDGGTIWLGSQVMGNVPNANVWF